MDAVRGRSGGGPSTGSDSDDRGNDAVEVPAPKKGGTFHYCEGVHKFGNVRVKAGRGGWVIVPCKKRFRKLSGYRRHFRQAHAE